MKRTCPHPKCEVGIPRTMFACRDHWRSLPSAIREAIWDAYNAFEKTMSSDKVYDIVAAAQKLDEEQKRAEAFWAAA